MEENINSEITNNENNDNSVSEVIVEKTVTDAKTVKKESGGVFLAILYLMGNFFLFNIVFIILLLPVVTIGTAFTAYFDIVFTAKYDKKHRDYSVKMLLQRFREHLKLTISYFVGYLLVMGFFIAIALLFSPIGPIPNKIFSVLFILMAGILFAILIYTFPVLAINAVTSDYRATVYALQDRDRAEKRAAEKEAEKAEEAAVETAVVAEASESEKKSDVKGEGAGSETSDNASQENTTQESHSHETEVLTAYMRRFSKVSRTPVESREIMKKGSYNVNSTVEKSDSSEDSQNKKNTQDQTTEANISEKSEDKSSADNLNKKATTRAVTITEPTYTYSATPIPEDRNSLGNVVLDSIYFAAKHFVGLMFTLILYLLPGAIVYLFYEDTVLLVTGFVLIGFRMIMGINARIYYGSFYEYDDELDEDTDENDSEEEIGDDEGDADIQEESISDDEEIEVTFEAVGETEEELSGEIDGVISDEDDAEEGSHTEEQAEEESHDDEEIEDKSSTAADRIKNMLNIHEDDSDEDADEDEDIEADEDSEADEETEYDADSDTDAEEKLDADNDDAESDNNDETDDDDIEVTF